VKPIQFEAKKVAIKQDKNGISLTLVVHPDDFPLELLQDFVGAAYQCVFVRTDRPHVDKQAEYVGGKHIQLAGILCTSKEFWEFLHAGGNIITKDEANATEWLRNYLEVQSRSELKDNVKAQQYLDTINREFKQWMQN
jgi:hypothetical protein